MIPMLHFLSSMKAFASVHKVYKRNVNLSYLKNNLSPTLANIIGGASEHVCSIENLDEVVLLYFVEEVLFMFYGQQAAAMHLISSANSWFRTLPILRFSR